MAGTDIPPGGERPDNSRGQMSQAERDAFKQRSDALGARLEAAKGAASSSSRSTSSGSPDNANAMGRALRISTELVGGVVVGAGIGWLIDKAAGTFPAFFIVFFLLGSAAGMVNIVRAGTAMKTGPSNPKAGPSVRDERDDDA